MLAIHGLTGYGGRWQHLAAGLPEISIAAPDLLGHGRSSWAAPWTIDANIVGVRPAARREADAPVLVVGHSFGGASLCIWPRFGPDQVAALLLLDPAVGLDGAGRATSPTRCCLPRLSRTPPKRAPEKAGGSWADVDPALLDAELDEHLVAAAQRTIRLAGQHAGDDVVLERAGPRRRVTARGNGDDAGAGEVDLTAVCHRSAGDALQQRLGADFELLDFDCHHMVADTRPVEVAALIREHYRGR